MKRFDGRVAFVTGAGHGIGRATIHRLVAEGARVVIGDIDQNAVTSLVGEIGDSAIAVRCDVKDTDSITFAVETAVSKFGHLMFSSTLRAVDCGRGRLNQRPISNGCTCSI